jgi:hypothetical protein
MTAAAAANSESTGRPLTPGRHGDGGAPGQSPPAAPPSHLVELKAERARLRKQLERMQAARDELESPGHVLEDIESESRSLEVSTAATLGFWASAGCEGPPPASSLERMAALARQREATQRAIDANCAAIGEINEQMATLRQRLVAVDDRIATEIAVVLVGEVDGKLAEVKAAADSLNLEIAVVMGLHSFLHKKGGHGFAQLAWQLSQRMVTPELGALRREIEAAETEWGSKYAELVA